MRTFWRSLLATITILTIAGAPGASSAAAQEPAIEPDEVFELEPCCQEKTQHLGSGPRATSFREIPAPRSGFDGEAMARLAAEGRRFAPRGRRLDVLGAEDDAARLLAPGVRKKFRGLNIQDGGGFSPPDTALAVGPDHVLQAVNVAVRLTNKSGKNAIVQTGQEHFGAESLFDPKVHYDPESGRFFIVMLNVDLDRETSRTFVSVSRSSRPASLTEADWCSYSFNNKRKGAWGDYPGLGVSGEWVAVGTNNFSFADFSLESAWLWVMDKRVLVDNAKKCPKNRVSAFRVRQNSDGGTPFTLQPAQHLDQTTPAVGDLYVLASEMAGFSTRYGLWVVSSNNSGEPRLRASMVEGSRYSVPPAAEQKKSETQLHTLGHRLMQQVVVREGAIWLAHASGCVLDGSDDMFACVRVERFPQGASKSDFSDLVGAGARFLWVPGIAVANNGDVILTFQMSSARHFLSVGVAGLRGGAQRFGAILPLIDEFDSVKTTFKGKCPLEPVHALLPIARTGDYIGAAQDPETDAIWISGEFAARLAGDCGWKTSIAQVRY
ncbi:MAG: hypothetical protein GKS06_14730 [Acidobacteria bacterium]|nr:hypothetical protein [Acidobacteriota bacterium]